jgi:hypothetical protein
VTQPSQRIVPRRRSPHDLYVIESSEPVPQPLRVWFRLRKLGGFFAFLVLVALALGTLLGIAVLVPSHTVASGEGVRTVASAFQDRPAAPAATTAPAARPPAAPDRVRPSGVPAVSAAAGTAPRTGSLSWGPAVDNVGVVRYLVWLDRLQATKVAGSARSIGLAFADCKVHRVAIAAVDAAQNVGPVTSAAVRPKC